LIKIPLDFTLKEVPDSAVWQGVIEKGTKWAYPNEDETKRKLKKIVTSNSKPTEWAAELAKHINNTYNLDVTGKYFVNIINAFLSQTKAISAKDENVAQKIGIFC